MSVHPGSVWLDQNWGSYPEGLWIAADASRLVAENYSYDGLIADLLARGFPLDSVTIAFFPKGIFQ